MFFERTDVVALSDCTIAFRTMSKVYDVTFLKKMFGRVLNTSRILS